MIGGLFRRLRRLLNDWLAAPALLFLQTWFLNVVISQVPFSSLRYAYYRRIIGMSIHPTSAIWHGARFTGDCMRQIKIGPNCSIAYDSFWVAGAPITLQNDVVFGHRVSLYTSDHDPDDPAFTRRNAPILIEDHVFVGSQVIILQGVTVGRGAAIAAGSVVTEDVPSFAIVAGNPARVVRERYAREFTYTHSGTALFK